MDRLALFAAGENLIPWQEGVGSSSSVVSVNDVCEAEGGASFSSFLVAAAASEIYLSLRALCGGRWLLGSLPCMWRAQSD